MIFAGICYPVLAVANSTKGRTAVCEIMQQNSVSGKVTDTGGNPLPGVTVVIKGTSSGSITDTDGNYVLPNVPRNSILVFSFVGMLSQEITVGDQTRINIAMQEETIGLQEVVAVGYGTMRKASITGSVASTDDKTIKKAPVTSLSNSLSGLLPGLTTLNRTGEPGVNVSEIYIRGRGTTGNSSPLVVVDGVPDETGAWQRINQNDIEQISILKDASSAIYGARAANGVILITTKRGSIGKPVFNYTFNQGLTQPTRLPEMANSWEFADYVNTYRISHGQEAFYTAEEIQIMKDGSDPLNYPNTNWIDLIFKKVSTQSMHNMNVRGGTDKAKYSISGSYTHENSLVKDGIHEYGNYSVRSNIDFDITNNIKFGLDLNGGIDDRTTPAVAGFGMAGSPLIPAFYPTNGLPTSLPGDIGENPAINLAGAGGYNNNKIFRTFLKPSFDINIKQVEGLGVDGYFSYRNEFTEDKRWREPWTVYTYNRSTDTYSEKKGGYVAKPDLRERIYKRKDYLVNLRLKYKRTFGNHDFDSFIAVEQAEGEYRFLEAYRRDFISGAIEELFAGSGENMVATGTRSEWGRQNIFGRLSYNYEGKYLFETNLRYDGSYAFPKNKRWGFFPGFSAGWRISQEKFMESASWINDLKLRVSYGTMGNDQIAAFQYLSMYNLSPIGTHFGQGTQAILTSGVAPNENITWEVAKNANIGLDATFWEGGLGLTLDAFKQSRSNILTARTTEVPVYTGLVLPHENIGIVENKGLELSISHRNKRNSSSPFNYSIMGNIGYAKNKIIDISEPQDMPDYQKAEGSSIGTQLLYKALGIFRTQAEVDSNPVMVGTLVGDLQYEDVNKDGVINAADRVRINKSSIPEITFGLNFTADYKDFSFFANFSGQARAWTYIHKYARTTQNSIREILANRYLTGSLDSKYPIIPQEDGVGEGEVSGMPSTFWLQNASFLRLKTLQLAYNLPNRFISKLGLASAMVFVNGNNLFLLTPLQWYDPEGEPESSEYSGINYSQGDFYPQTKIYNIGLNITF
ncbi:MAG: TonB-dependent receptor [Parabacteroides sp.]|nr:TonB-dependent receptor [Parabacteroides sp.]